MKRSNHTDAVIQSRRIDKIKSFDFIFLTLSILFVLFLSIFRITQSNSIKLFPDEIGFWQNAALLTGRDWSGSGSEISYYGYGFGFLLAPIMLIFKTSSARMHAAVFLQALMLCSCIFAARLILLEIAKDAKKYVIRILSVLPALYSAYLFMTKVTLAEILLLTCMWWWLYTILVFIKKKNFVSGVFCALIPVYMYAVHQRTLPFIFIAAIIILSVSFCSFIKGRNKKDILICILLCCIIAIAFILAKQYEDFYISKIYSTAENGSKVASNTVEGRAGAAISLLFSFSGILSIIKSALGKIFYSIVASYGLVAFGIFAGLISIWNLIRNKSDNQIRDLMFVIILINFLIAVGVSAVQTLGNYEERFDWLLYGRYSEYTLGPLIMSGCLMLFQDWIPLVQKKLIVIFCIFVTLLLTLFCVYLSFDDASISIFWVSCSGLDDLRWLVRNMGITNKGLVLIAGIRSILFMGVLYIILDHIKKMSILLPVFLGVIAICWIFTADISWTGNVMNWYEALEECQIDITEDIKNEAIVGFLDASNIGCFQFLLSDTYLAKIDTIYDISDDYHDIYIITDASSDYADKIRSYYYIDKENNQYILWKYQ